MRPSSRVRFTKSSTPVNISSFSCNSGSLAARPIGKMANNRQRLVPSPIKYSFTSENPTEITITEIGKEDADYKTAGTIINALIDNDHTENAAIVPEGAQLGAFTHICDAVKIGDHYYVASYTEMEGDDQPQFAVSKLDESGNLIKQVTPAGNEFNLDYSQMERSRALIQEGPNNKLAVLLFNANQMKIFTTGALEIMKRIKDYGGMASCTQLAVKYGETKNFYNSGSVALARRVCEATGITPNTRDDGSAQWWTVLYTGRDAGKDEEGSFVWKLRDELSAALEKVDLSSIELYVAAAPGEQDCGYWWLNANPKIWSFADIAVGEVQSYTLYNENGNKRRIFQNFLDAKAGDMIIGYESNPVKQIVAIGRVSAEQDGEKLFFEKVEGLTSTIDYATLRGCPELERMEYFQNPQGSLFKLTRGEYDFILDMIREENPVTQEDSIDDYTKSEFLDEVYMTEKRYENLVAVLRNKKNIILQGAPGVGKTFAARRLAWSMMGKQDDSRIEFVQFHQNYSYEDFMMGYKPVDDGFELKYGIFYRFCQKAANQPDKDFFFIIDEINRGNMSKIFGELLMLIEKDYRGTKVTLAYNGLTFSVPKNLYIIGMMNTADRSLAMIDYALRRRFSFFEVEPGFDSEGFIQYQNELNNETLNELVNKVKDLNREITLDKSLGKGFCIGHSYFCGRDVCTEEWLHSIVDYDILPMLSEYWFDDANKLQRWENILQGVFQ